MSVYFIRNTVSGRYKVGTSKNPKARLSTLQTGNDDLLEIALVVEGGETYERELHKRLESLRVRGEWFDPGEKLMSILEWLRDAPQRRLSEQARRIEFKRWLYSLVEHKRNVYRAAMARNRQLAQEATDELEWSERTGLPPSWEVLKTPLPATVDIGATLNALFGSRGA